MMNTDSTDFDFTVPERPKFLKVLCILTFISSAWIVLTNSFTLFNYKDVAKGMENAKVQVNKNDSVLQKQGKSQKNAFQIKMIRALSTAMTPENVRYNAMGNILAQLFCFFGAFLMWKLNKKGYPLYILGIALGIAVPFYLYGNNFIAVFAALIPTFFGVLFVVFYGMNLKAMTK